ncbi:MAG: hypothetical protein K0R17_3309 [Rariglobus sp.]|jgi:uncharacterized damage-inducible protein DinB|nr:hypothetical protein [Rariglobus sp.]
MIAHCIRDNVEALRQGIGLLAGLSSEGYTLRAPACFNSSAGGHLRHVIEHYLSFLQGTDTGEIDYEARARDPLIENDPVHAAAQLEAIGERLAQLVADRTLLVRVESASLEETSSWSMSTVVRELEFLLSHTVHHYALIAVICRLGGQAIPDNFGMAPSTLRHLRDRSAIPCAR